MASYVFPGNATTYVPSLSSDLIVAYSRNKDKFPIVEYCDYTIVDKPRLLYTAYQNDGQNRVNNTTDSTWADGADSPKQNNGNSAFQFVQVDCIRKRLSKTIGQIAVDNAGWDILDLEANFLAMQHMTRRVQAIHNTLTTSSNWSGNYATATTAGGGTWSAATSTNTYIRDSLAYARIQITLGTLGVVQADDLYLVLNPNAAKTMALSNEFLDFVKQNPTAIEIWQGQKQYQLYGLPNTVMGLRVIVDDTVVNANYPGTTASESFTLSNSYAILLSKQKAIKSAATASFSTYQAFLFEDLVTEVFNDPKNRRYELFVTDNSDLSHIVAPASGFLIKIDS